MTGKAEVVMIGPARPAIAKGLSAFDLIDYAELSNNPRRLEEVAPRVRAMAVSVSSQRVDGALMQRFPRLEIVSSFGVGYDHVDAAWAGAHGITVTNTPDVLTE